MKQLRGSLYTTWLQADRDRQESGRMERYREDDHPESKALLKRGSRWSIMPLLRRSVTIGMLVYHDGVSCFTGLSSPESKTESQTAKVC